MAVLLPEAGLAVKERGTPGISTVRTLPTVLMPGGEKHCGGNLIFPNMTIVGSREGSDKMPAIIMTPTSMVMFDARASVHGTDNHDNINARAPG